MKTHRHAKIAKHIQQHEHANVVPAQQAVPQLPANQEQAQDRNRRHDPMITRSRRSPTTGSTSSQTATTDTDTTAKSKRRKRAQISHSPTSTELGEPHARVSQQRHIAAPGQFRSDRTIYRATRQIRPRAGREQPEQRWRDTPVLTESPRSNQPQHQIPERRARFSHSTTKNFRLERGYVCGPWSLLADLGVVGDLGAFSKVAIAV